jgi:hypothetical protein
MMWKFPEAWQQNMKKARGDEGPYLSNNNLLGATGYLGYVLVMVHSHRLEIFKIFNVDWPPVSTFT